MKVDRVQVQFGKRTVLHDITAEAQPGCLTGILGPNGSGKTTLLRAMGGLQRIESGCITLDDREVSKMRAKQRAACIGVVPQRFRADVPFSVAEIVAMGTTQQKAIANALEVCELGPHANQPFPSLSVGQQQRVVIARALAQVHSPGVLLLDEPLAALDLKHALSVLELLRDRAKQGDRVILSLHDLGVASACCDQVWLLHEGRLVQAGTPDEVLSEGQLREVFSADFERIQRRDGREWIVPMGG